MNVLEGLRRVLAKLVADHAPFNARDLLVPIAIDCRFSGLY